MAPQGANVRAETVATVVGWGSRENNLPTFLPRDVEVMVRPEEVCPGLHANGTELSPSDLCAAVDEGGKDSCVVSAGKIFHREIIFIFRGTVEVP